MLLLQVFVANPNKTRPIVEILVGNRDKLLKYLTDFHSDKGGCSSFLILVADVQAGLSLCRCAGMTQQIALLTVGTIKSGSFSAAAAYQALLDCKPG